MIRSFRFRLSARFTIATGLGFAALSLLTFFAIRETLDGQIDASLIAVASIQAASLTDAPSGEMHFHEWELTPDEAAQVRDLNRFAQVWSETGESLLRTRYITDDLPLDPSALRAAVRGELVWIEDAFQGIPVRSLYYPLGRLGPLHGQHVLQVAAPLETRNRLLRNAALVMLALFAIMTASALGGSWWLADRAMRPVKDIAGHAADIGAATLGRRITAHADTLEYERLVQVLNTMLARIDAAFEAQRRFTADASHELRSPLTAMRGELELARRRPRDAAEYERVIDSAIEEAARLSRVAEDLLTLARSDAGAIRLRPVATDLLLLARQAVDRVGIAASHHPVRIAVSGAADALADVDEDLVLQLLWNLVANAVKFTTAGGDVAVSVATEGEAVVVRVADSGTGIPEEALDRIFDRFYRVDVARTASSLQPGTGLGLAIVRAIAELHGATLSVRNRRGGGAEFTVRFFRTLPASAAGEARPLDPRPT
ncbi:MAG: HAMP domain-containing histidine kinase [Gemmatimonadetes bacterium]|nr:HAMP domain-containing histidine kinase [Gemmatimonadota bacterium]